LSFLSRKQASSPILGIVSKYLDLYLPFVFDACRDGNGNGQRAAERGEGRRKLQRVFLSIQPFLRAKNVE
jgi:hypothetical protein